MDGLNNYFTAKYVVDEGKKKLGQIFLFGGLGLGALLILIAIVSKGAGLPIMLIGYVALPAVIVGIIILNSKKTVYMTGEEYDSEVKRMMKKLGTNPREYVGLDSTEVEEIEPISFEGYRFVGAVKVRKDPKDYQWRSDLYEKVIVFFTSNEVHMYKVFLNILSGKITETTDVLFYDDIVSVSTKNEVEKVGSYTIEYISFNLISKGGNSVSVAINGNDDRQKSINAMRAMIKEKKTL